jgi:hypothetical protein
VEASRAQPITTQQQQQYLTPAPDPPYIGTATRLWSVTVRVTCLWWPISHVHYFAGATTPAQKRHIRQDLQKLATRGVDGVKKGKRGHWVVASAVATERYQDRHDEYLIRRVAEAERRKMEAERRKAAVERRPADTERKTPPSHVRLQAASYGVERTSGGEVQTEAGQKPALQDV